MDYFELAKRRVAVFTWIFLLVVVFLIFTRVHGESEFPVICGLLFCFVLLNLSLTLSAVNRKISSRLFFLILVGFVILCTLIFYYSRGLHSSFFLFMLPLVAASMCFQIMETLIMAFIISLMDIMVTVILAPPDTGAFSPDLVSRILFYFLISVLVNHHFDRSRTALKNQEKEVHDREKEVQELKINLSELNSFHTRLLDEKAETDQIREALNKEVKYRESLFNISRTLTQTLELKNILSQLLKTLNSSFSFVSGAVFLTEKETQEIYMAASEGGHQQEMKRQVEDSSFCMPGIVIQKNQALLIADTEQDPRFSAIAAGSRVLSAYYLPLSLDMEIFGALCLWFDRKDGCSEKDVELLRAICLETARAIKNAELYRTLDKRLNFMVTLWNTSKNFASVIELSSPARKDLLEKVLSNIKVLFSVDSVIFYMYESESGSLMPSVLHNLAIGEGEGTLGLTREEIENSHLLDAPIQINDINVSSYRKVFNILAKIGEAASLYWYPLRGRERIIGALAFISRHSREWSNEESQWADIFCTIFSMSLENITLLEDIFSEKNQLEVLVDNMPEGVFTTDNERRIITWNKAALKITGWSREEVTGKSCENFIRCQTPESDLCEDGCIISTSIKDMEKKESYGKNIHLCTKNGEKIPVYLTVAPVYVTRQRVSGSICLFRDITREKEIEKIKEEFLATVTHDLKSPLASIMGYAELMGSPKAGELSKKQKEFNDAILRSCKTLEILINNILMNARLEAGEMQYTYDEFSVNELFNEIHEMFHPIANYKKIRLIPQENRLMARADREKIKEVLANLLGNAIKFTPEQGSIMLRGTMENERISISVSDTGKGILEDEIPRLFEKFAQARGEKRGTGLGLFIIKKIIEDHGQTISVNSSPGRGTIFTFTLEGKEIKE